MTTAVKIKDSIKRHGLFRNGDRVIVAVSGGPDSVALLCILHELRYDLGIRIRIAHIDHKIRKDSSSDYLFVKKLAQKLLIPFTGTAINVKKIRKGGSLEDKAREARFRFLIQTAKKYKANVIALGHTRDDLAETVLMRIIRGTGLSGMRAILPKRTIQSVLFVRPLLEASKAELKLFLKKKHIAFRTDSTNTEKQFLRNRTRLHLVPILENQYNKNTKKLLAHLANTIAYDYDYIEHQAQTILKKILKKHRIGKTIRFELPKFLKYHTSIQRMLLRLSIARLKGNTNLLTLAHIAQIEELITKRPSGSIVDLPGRISVIKDKTAMQITIRNP